LLQSLLPVIPRIFSLAAVCAVLLGGAHAAASIADAVAVALRAANAPDRDLALREVVASGRGAIPALAAALLDPDYRVRRRACRALLRIGDERAVPALLDSLYRDEPASEARAAAAWAAYRLGHAPALEAVRAEMTSRYWHRRLNAIADLAALGDAGASPIFGEALADRSWIVRRRALQALRLIDPRPHAAALASLAAGDPEWPIRREALEVLHGLGPSNGVDEAELDGLLAMALADEVPEIRRRAAQWIGEGRRAVALAEAVPFSLAHDQDDAVRAHLAAALATAPDPSAAKLLRRRLRDPSWLVRASALASLRALGERPPLAPLFAELGRLPDGEVARAAAALARLGDPDAVSGLAERAAGGDDRAARLLGLLGQDPAWRERVRARALALLSDRPAARRAAGARIAGALLDPGLFATLTERLADEALVVRAEAARALGALAPVLPLGERERAVPPLAAAAGARSPLGPAARVALEALATRGLSPASLRLLVAAPAPEVRALGLRALALLGAGADEALRALGDSAPEVRASAVVALAAAFPPGVSAALASAAAAQAPVDARAAQAALEALAARLSDPEPAVRVAAARALWILGDPRGRRALRAALSRALGGSDPASRLAAARDLAALAEGDRSAQDALVPLLVDGDSTVRSIAREALRAPSAGDALRAAATGRGMAARAAAHLLAERGAAEGPAALFADLARIGPREVRALGEIDPHRLADLLAVRVRGAAGDPSLRDYLRRVVAPDLLAALARDLAAEVRTRWRGTPAYNLRRQHLYDREIARAVLHFPGLHPKVLKALVFQESNFEPIAGNRFDCVGLAAFCRGAAAQEGLALAPRPRDFDADERYRPAAALEAAVRHLRRKAQLLEEGPFRRYGAPRGNDYWAFVLAAYNGGHHQVAEAMRRGHEEGIELARAQGLRGARAAKFAREHATRWLNLLVPEEAPEDSPLYEMTERRYPWYRPYGRYRRMRGAEAKYHEIGQFPLDILERAFEDEVHR
jgi:HEAT repeat protein